MDGTKQAGGVKEVAATETGVVKGFQLFDYMAGMENILKQVDKPIVASTLIYLYVKVLVGVQLFFNSKLCHHLIKPILVHILHDIKENTDELDYFIVISTKLNFKPEILKGFN